MLIDTENSNGFLLDGFYRPAASNSRPAQLVVILHGLSAYGAGMIAFGDYWASALPDASFLAPNAPFPLDMGPTGRQRFGLENGSDVLQGLRHTAGILNAFLDDALAKLGLNDSKLALVGFSQGGAVALHVGLQRTHPPGALVCISGMLVEPESLEHGRAVWPAVLLTHGAEDGVVHADAMASAKQRLGALGVAVESVLQPGLDHRFDDVTIETVSRFLARHLQSGLRPGM